MLHVAALSSSKHEQLRANFSALLQRVTRWLYAAHVSVPSAHLMDNCLAHGSSSSYIIWADGLQAPQSGVGKRP